MTLIEAIGALAIIAGLFALVGCWWVWSGDDEDIEGRN
jgi:hypothetical protein